MYNRLYGNSDNLGVDLSFGRNLRKSSAQMSEARFIFIAAIVQSCLQHYTIMPVKNQAYVLCINIRPC